MHINSLTTLTQPIIQTSKQKLLPAADADTLELNRLQIAPSYYALYHLYDGEVILPPEIFPERWEHRETVIGIHQHVHKTVQHRTQET